MPTTLHLVPHTHIHGPLTALIQPLLCGVTHFLHQVVFNTVLENKRPEVPDDLPGRPAGCLAGYKKLMEECWAQDPRERPTFTAAANRLKALQLWESTHRRKLRAAAANGEAGVDGQSAAGGCKAIVHRSSTVGIAG